MTPEQLLAIGPSATAVFVALLGVVVQVFTRKADDARAAAQRAADDARAAAQREMDERRWREQREADESRFKAERDATIHRLATEHAQEMELRKHEESVKRATSHHERLRTDAAALLAVVGEVQAAAAIALERYKELMQCENWDMQGHLLASWSAELRARLAVAAATVTLYGGDVGASARELKNTLDRYFSELAQDYQNGWTGPSSISLDSPIDAFSAVVLAEAGDSEV